MTARSLPGARRRGHQQGRQFAGLLFLAPLILLWGLFLIVPIIETMYYSLMQWDGLSAVWNGVGNYLTLLHSADFANVLINNALLLLSVPFAVMVPFFIALIIAAEPPGWRWVRALIFLPATLSWVVTGIVWLRVFSSDGMLNAGLRAIGLDGFFSAVRTIILPLMTRFIIFATIITLIAAFTALFSLIFVMTGGGPGFSTTTMEFYIYRLAFGQTDFGMGATVGVVLLVVIALVSVPLMGLYRRASA
jgi:ABC-type sugar transport system permease subunit